VAAVAGVVFIVFVAWILSDLSPGMTPAAIDDFVLRVLTVQPSGISVSEIELMQYR
jgi:hypothetical protein